MKRKITLLLLAAGSVLTMNSQVVLNEEFTEPFNLAASGWVVENLSTNSNTVSWTQGNQTGGNGTSTAYSGGANDFYCADFLSIAPNSAGDISAWLITPTVTIYNGAVLQFATRTLSFTSPNIYPDRLQVRMAQTSNTTIAGSTGVGAFSTLMLDINPNLTTNNASVMTTSSAGGYSVNGYPMSWTVYSLQVSGVTGTVTGRFAFRYFVTNGGQTGANSRFVGVDAVNYTLPCGPTVPSFTTCANSPVTLSAQNGLPATSYLWTNSANSNTYTTASINFTTGSSTTVYSLTPSIGGSVSCGVTITATVTIGSTASMSLTSSAGSNTVCAGTVVTLTAQDASNTYTWSPVSSNNAVITVTPNTTTTYSVGSATGVFPNLCIAGNSITVAVKPNPTVTISYTNMPVCSGGTFYVNASGASTYTYVFAFGQTTANPISVSPGTATVESVGQYIVAGTGTNGCTVAGLATYTIEPLPTVSVSTSNTVACRGTSVTLTADGANTYSWSGTGITAATSTNNPLSFGTGTATGNRTVTVVGTDSNGCQSSATFVQVLNPCLGIETISGNGEASIYPNPFSNELRLTGINGSVEIYNALGQMVVKTTVKNDEVINTTDLTKGVYIIKAYNTSGELNKTVKLLKN